MSSEEKELSQHKEINLDSEIETLRFRLDELSNLYDKQTVLFEKQREDILSLQQRLGSESLKLRLKQTELIEKQQQITALEKLIQSRKSREVFEPGANVLVGPQKHKGKVVRVILCVDGTLYQVGWWVEGIYIECKVIAEYLCDADEALPIRIENK